MLLHPAQQISGEANVQNCVMPIRDDVNAVWSERHAANVEEAAGR